MNKISRQILSYIQNDNEQLAKVLNLKDRFNNHKDFTNQIGYVIMDVVSTEKRFFDIDRKEIEVNEIAQELF